MKHSPEQQSKIKQMLAEALAQTQGYLQQERDRIVNETGGHEEIVQTALFYVLAKSNNNFRLEYNKIDIACLEESGNVDYIIELKHNFSDQGNEVGRRLQDEVNRRVDFDNVYICHILTEDDDISNERFNGNLQRYRNNRNYQLENNTWKRINEANHGHNNLAEQFFHGFDAHPEYVLLSVKGDDITVNFNVYIFYINR